MADVIVFAGPCRAGLDVDAWDATWALRPPAQRGDIVAVLAERPRTLVLLDGYYYDVGAVTHKELMYALDAGIRVIGSASIGALRAVEMARFGMEGVGQVFEWFRDGVLDGDDEVAILHGPPELGYLPLSIALVNLRAGLETIVAEGCVAASAADSFIATVKSMPFNQRFPDAVFGHAGEILGDVAGGKLRNLVESDPMKHRDARAAIQLARARRARPKPKPRRLTSFMSRERERWIRIDQPEGRTATGEPSLEQVWNVCAVLHPGTPSFLRDVRHRYIMASADGLGTSDDNEMVPAITEQIRMHVDGRGGRRVLPDAELAEEARIMIRAHRAGQRFGHVGAAATRIGDPFGLLGQPALPVLEELMEVQPGLLPRWWMMRAFALSQAFEPACVVAREALAIHRCFERWSGGRRVVAGDLIAFAESLWPDECEPHSEAARRGLTIDRPLDVTTRNALELLAPAERLLRPINGYPEAKQALLRTPLDILRIDVPVSLSTAPSVKETTC